MLICSSIYTYAQFTAPNHLAISTHFIKKKKKKFKRIIFFKIFFLSVIELNVDGKFDFYDDSRDGKRFIYILDCPSILLTSELK